MTRDKLICKNCFHHLREHRYANPDSLTPQERKDGLIPWLCTNDDSCECIEFLPSARGELIPPNV